MFLSTPCLGITSTLNSIFFQLFDQYSSLGTIYDTVNFPGMKALALSLIIVQFVPLSLVNSHLLKLFEKSSSNKGEEAKIFGGDEINITSILMVKIRFFICYVSNHTKITKRLHGGLLF